ncbi:MAG TPA: hypothetical protein EYP14_01670, partial [Planctomycetaceae bacterium]|nr:hypothetical protein [Planctomycetaceae bacterium]
MIPARSRSRRILPAFCLASVSLLVGCQSARYVLKEPDRGVVAIPVTTLNWPVNHRKSAEKLMADHFPEGYVIDREEEVVVGQRMHYYEDTHESEDEGDGSITRVAGVSGFAETEPKRELRISYHRVDSRKSAAARVGA